MNPILLHNSVRLNGHIPSRIHLKNKIFKVTVNKYGLVSLQHVWVFMN